MQIVLNLQGHRLLAGIRQTLSSGSKEVDEIKLEVDETWKGFGKIAVFCVGKKCQYTVVDEVTQTAKIPAEVLRNEAVITIGIVGFKDEAVMTSTLVVYQIEKGSVVTIEEPEPSIYAEILSRYADLATRFNNIIANAGDLTNNAELIDARVGADDVVYDTLGEAVRGQVNLLFNEKESGITNLIDLLNFFDGKTIGASFEIESTSEDSNDKIVVTTNTAYGRYEVSYTTKGILPSKFLNVVKFNALEVPESTKYRMAMHAFKDSVNNGELIYKDTGLTITEPGEYVLVFESDLTDEQILNKVNRVDIGLMPNISGSKFEFFTYNLFDISSFNQNAIDVLKDAISNNFIDSRGFFIKTDNLLSLYAIESESSREAEHSATSDLADEAKHSADSDVSEYSRFSSISDSAHNAITDEYVIFKDFNVADAKSAFTCTVNSIEGNEVTFTIGAIYAGILIPTFPIRKNKKYSFIIERVPKKSDLEKINVGYIVDNKWEQVKRANDIEIEGKTYSWITIVTDDNTTEMNGMNFVFENGVVDETPVSFKFLFYGEKSDGTDLTEDDVIEIVTNGLTYNIYKKMNELGDRITSAESMVNNIRAYWKNKNVLFIGDSITAALKYQNKVKELLDINIFNHCKGGIGLTAMVDGDKGLGGDYDNETGSDGTELKPLSIEDVSGKDLIVFLGGYNDRGTEDGNVGDLYDPEGGEQNTIAGKMQYCINRIYEELEKANNLTCKLLIVTVDCAGKYPWIDADGYEEWPADSGRTMETLANTQKAVAEYNSLLCCDLWHNSGINKNTWNVFGSHNNSINEQYSPYELNAEGEPINQTRIKYVKGQSYYQWRDGKVVLEEYTGDSPYPYNGDQLHKSIPGYDRIGECMVGTIIKGYGI